MAFGFGFGFGMSPRALSAPAPPPFGGLTVANEGERYSLPGIPDMQLVMQTDTGVIWEYRAPNNAFAGVMLLPNGGLPLPQNQLAQLFIPNGELNGKSSYISASNAAVFWDTGSDSNPAWVITDTTGAQLYESADDTGEPWDAVFWQWSTGFMDSANVTVQQVQSGDLTAGINVVGGGSTGANGVYPFPSYNQIGGASGQIQNGGASWTIASSGFSYYYTNVLLLPWRAEGYYAMMDGVAPPPTLERNDIASPANWFVAPVFDQLADSGTISPIPWFNAGGSGTLEFTFTRPSGSGAAYLCAFKAPGGLYVGPVIYDGDDGTLYLRHRTNAGGDVINHNCAHSSGNEHVVVIAWDAGTGSGRESVWVNGELQSASTDITGTALADNQTTLEWGAAGMSGVRVRYWPSRFTSPP